VIKVFSKKNLSYEFWQTVPFSIFFVFFLDKKRSKKNQGLKFFLTLRQAQSKLLNQQKILNKKNSRQIMFQNKLSAY